MVLKMKNRIAIIANGNIRDINFHNNILQKMDLIICADGGANNAKNMGIVPDYIIGDLDSTNSNIIDFFKDKNTKIIEDKNKEKTDLELAISLAKNLDPDEITIIGAFGDRIDHTLANIYCLGQINSDIKAKIIDEKNIVELVDSQIEIEGEKNDIVSVIPISDISDLNYEGFRWNLKNYNANSGWFAVSNELKNNKAKICLKKGKILVIKCKD
jgi:thiamine pyrophosphokinase